MVARMGFEESHTAFDREETLFSLQFTVVMLEHIRIISQFLRKKYDITLNEYCTLVFFSALDECVDNVRAAKFLACKQGTFLSVLSSLEESGYVYKLSNPRDGRCMLIKLTPAGSSLTGALADEVMEIMQATFWKTLPESIYLQPLKECEAQLAAFEGEIVQDLSLRRDTPGLAHALLFRIIRLVVDAWTEIAREQAGLSLNEARILILLELYEQQTPSDIAKRLRIENSAASLSLRRLSTSSFIQCNPSQEDRRIRFYRCSAKGVEAARKLFSELRKATCDIYSTYSDEAIIDFNAQHIQMYKELTHIDPALENLLSD